MKIAIEIKQNKECMEEVIKIKKEDIKVGNKVTCLSNSKPYVITEVDCRMKYDGNWHNCVIYTPLYDNPFKCFVRSIEDFAQKFLLGSVEEKEERHSNLENIGKNLKPFDLQAAKAGKPVCTRDGKKARIVCFDRKVSAPIIALIERVDDIEILQCVYSDGKCRHDMASNNDLMMLPEKKEGWVNVYKDLVYDTKDKAIRNIAPGTHFIDTIKVEWEEQP